MVQSSSRFSLTLPSDSRMVSVVRSFLEAICQASNLDRNVTFAAVLATAEAVSNIIRHAHKSRAEAMIQLHCQLTAEHLEILLLDEGEPFDITTVPHLDPSELRVGGRGVYLMRSLMDELACQPRSERGNVLRMVKRRHEETSVRECG